MHLNYKQLNLIFKSTCSPTLQVKPQVSQSIMSPINEEHKTLIVDDSKLHMDGQLQVVETNKSFWLEELTKVHGEAFIESDEYIKDMLLKKSKKSRVTAIVSYKKGHHLKLIPFFKPPASS